MPSVRLRSAMVRTSSSPGDHDNEIVLVKNPNYKGNRTPKNDGVTFKVYTKDDAAYADIQSGAPRRDGVRAGLRHQDLRNR